MKHTLSPMKQLRMKHLFITLLIILPMVIFGCSSGENNGTQQESSAPPAATVNEGQQVFKANCIACHGDDGTAGIANAANLQTSKLSKLQMMQTIIDGRNSMPSFKDRLTSDNISHVADYVYALHKQ